MGTIDPQVVRSGHEYSAGAVVQRLTLWRMIHFSRTLVLAQCAFWCVVVGGSQVMLQLGLKLSTKCASLRASWEGPYCQPISAVACDLLGATWHKLLNEL